jgi:predicted Zn-dependent peptidase
MTFHEQKLDNGLELIAECNPHALSTAVGFFVRTGSRDESPAIAGVSHFLEHMAFKGSDHRTAEDVNRLFDEIGAKYNAYTTEEHTVYYAAVLPEYLPRVVDLLGDLLRPSLRTEDFNLEKKVILEEIGMYADSPQWCAFERIMRLHFNDHPLGNSVLGTQESISELAPEAMREYHRRAYSANNIFVAAAGNFAWQAFADLVAHKCSGWTAAPRHERAPARYEPGPSELMRRDEFVQQWLLVLTPGPPADNPLHVAASVLATIIGDETGSRFYWTLVDPSKVDHAEFNYHEFEGAGAFLAGASCKPGQTEEVLEVVRNVVDGIARHGVTDEELRQAKNKIGSRIVLAAERPQNRLSSLGYNWSYRRDYRTAAADLAEVESVTADSIRELLDRYPLNSLTIVTLGPLAELPNLNLS